MRRLDPRETTILVIDVQEKLAAAMPPAAVADVTRAATVLLEAAWSSTRSKTAIVLGMEAHVCVFQTVRELTARGVSVLVPIDGVASRRDDHRAAGLELCRSAGALLTTMETIVFDWLQRAGTPEFKKISKLVR